MTTSLSSLLGVTPIAGTLPVAYGGTGLTVPGTTGNVLTSNGTTWSSQPAPISLPTQTGNTGKYLITDGTNAAWATVVGGLISTPTKTANYTAAANELVRVNATSSFSITLPASPTDGAIVGILDIANTFSANNITILPGAGATIEDSNSVLLDISNTYAAFTYISSTTNWRLLSIPNVGGGGGGLAVTTIVTANYTANPSDLILANTTSNSFNVTLPSGPVNGTTVSVLDITNTFNGYPLTVLPGTGATIEGDTSVVLDVDHTYAEFVYLSSSSNWVWKGTPSASTSSSSSSSSTNGKMMVLSMLFG